jgi:uncharacterized protein (TIGR03067 family)
MRTRLLLLISLMLIAGFAPAPFPRATRPDPKGDDLRKLQGTWVVLHKHYGGNKLNYVDAETHFTIAGRRMTCTVNGETRSEWNIELDPSARPRALTKKMVSSEVVLQAIYRFTGDKLMLCQGDVRPKDFDSTGRCWLLVMRRR